MQIEATDGTAVRVLDGLLASGLARETDRMFAVRQQEGHQYLTIVDIDHP
jgi:hypothetical protein